LEDIFVVGKIILKLGEEKQDEMLWTGFVSSKGGTSGVPWRTERAACQFQTWWQLSCLSEGLSASQNGLCFVESYLISTNVVKSTSITVKSYAVVHCVMHAPCANLMRNLTFHNTLQNLQWK
jgi:hypothetical protein